jgi:shikimate kinase
MGRRNVFLIGMPSSGKSTLGRRLAKELGYVYVDLDQQIVEDQELSIPEIFQKVGEAGFREIESRLLKSIPVNKSLMIATGGGAPCFFDNMEFIEKGGLSVFLDVTPAELAARIRQHAKDDRPLLSGLDDLQAELERKLKDRLPYYRRADVILPEAEDVNEFIRRLPALLEQECE